MYPANAEAALQKMKEGNARYIAGRLEDKTVDEEKRLSLLRLGQKPYATVVGCSDSRVPVEMLFDAGIGEIFIIRTAGNVAGAIEIGSVEYAVAHLHTPLVVVLGHQNCGAVKAAIDGGSVSPHLQAIMDEIQPSVPSKDSEDRYTACEDANIQHTIQKLMTNEDLAKKVQEGEILIIGAKYQMDTGHVHFF